MAVIKGQSSGGTLEGAGWIYIADVQTQGAGTVTSKVWQDPPGNTVLQSFTTSSTAIRVAVRASYPSVEVGGVAAVLTRDASGGFYSGQVDVTATAGDLVAKVFTGDGIEGENDTTAVTIDPPPTVLTLQFTGGYPGTQTELKAGDAFQLTGTTDKAIDQVDILDYGALQADSIVASGTAFTVTGTVADRGDAAVARPGRLRVRDAGTGAYSATRDTNELGGTVDGTDTVVCNDLRPVIGFGAVTYPGSQQALKASETASVINTIQFYNTVLYDSPGAQLAVVSPTVPGSPKVVQRTGGTYNVTVPNLRITANRIANDATTVAESVVNIANAAPVVTVSPPAARLRSGGNDGTAVQSHIITLTADQRLLTAPTLNADPAAGGTFAGVWSGAGAVWTRALQVHDDDGKGTKTWQGLVATNLSGLVTNTVALGATYELGGFVPRSLTFAAFSQQTAVNVAVVNYNKVVAGVFSATNQPAVRNAVQGDTSDQTNTYTILSPLNTKPQTLWWNDVTQANTNSSGTAQITDVEETV